MAVGFSLRPDASDGSMPLLKRVKRGQVLAVALTLLALGLSTCSSGSTSEATGATLRVITPAAKVYSGTGAAGVSGMNGQSLAQGDVIKTSAKGVVQIDYSDGSFTRVGPSSEFTLTTLSTEMGSRKIEQTIGVGSSFSRVRKLTGSESFSVTTEFGTATVRGTQFATACTESGCEFSVKEGEVTAVIDGEEVDSITPGEAVVLDPSGSSGVQEPSSEMSGWLNENEQITQEQAQESASPGTPQPSEQATPRLSGTWQVESTVIGTKNSVDTSGEVYVRRWIFEPQCPGQDPCEIKLERQRNTSDVITTYTLQPADADGFAYTGSTTSLSPCFLDSGEEIPDGVESTETVTLEVTEVSSDGQVLAFTGTLYVELTGKAEGCADGRVKYSFSSTQQT